MKQRPKVLIQIAGLAVLALALAAAAGCGARRLGSSPGELELATPQLELGHQAFMTNCNGCHPGGRAGKGVDLIAKRSLPGFIVKWKVRHGGKVMPAFGEDKVSDEQLQAVVAYLKALRVHWNPA